VHEGRLPRSRITKKHDLVSFGTAKECENLKPLLPFPPLPNLVQLALLLLYIETLILQVVARQ
jgi:hypothetical protein